MEPDGRHKRGILGEETVKAIRFPIMMLEDFAGVVLDSKILNADEVSSIIKYLSSVSSSAGGFSVSERSSVFRACGTMQRCFRFKSFHKFLIKSGLPSVIEFSVDKGIVLHGVYVCGEGTPLRRAIELTVSTSNRNLAEVSGEFSVEKVICHAKHYWGFKVLLNKKLHLKKNTLYRMEAKTFGKIRYCGNQIFNPLICSGVTFTFGSEPDDDFPELLFSL